MTLAWRFFRACTLSWRRLVFGRALLLVLIGVAPARAAVDAENPSATERASVAEEAEPPRAVSQPTNASPLLVAERPRDTAIYCVMGLGTPVGLAGLEGVHRFGSQFEISAGFGGGLAALGSEHHAGFGHVVQWAVMPRMRLGDDHNAFTAGAGASGGNYGDIPLCLDGPPCTDTYRVSYFVWSNFELGGEHWSSGGLAFRYFAGYAHGWCASSSCVSAATNIPYFGIGVGYAFSTK